MQLIRCVKLEYTFVVGVDRTERRADGNECESCTEVVCSASFGVKDVMTSRVMLDFKSYALEVMTIRDLLASLVCSQPSKLLELVIGCCLAGCKQVVSNQVSKYAGISTCRIN